MNIITTTGVANATAYVEKGISALILYTDVKIEDLDTEKIEIIVDRNGRNNTNITPSKISLKKFALACSYGSDAITAFQAGVDGAFETVVIMELADDGAIHLEGNDKIKVSLSGLVLAKNYVIDGWEDPNVTVTPFTFEEKNILASTTNVSLNTANFDMAVIEDSNSIESIDLRWENGRTTTHSRRELRAFGQDLDPVAYVKKDGKVVSGYVGLIQLPLLNVEEMVIRKSNADDVDILFRMDMTDDDFIG